MGYRGLYSLLVFLFMHAIGSGSPQEPRELLIDEQTSLKIHQTIDSLYLVGDFSSAIEQTLILMSYYRNNGDLAGEITCNNYMGDFLRAAGSQSKSLEYLRTALALNPSPYDSVLLAKTYNYLAASYFEYCYPAFLDSAKIFATASMAIASEVRDDKLVYRNLNILGKVEEGKGKLDSALFYMKQALDIVQRVNPIDKPLVLSNIAGVYFLKGELAKSRELALEAYDQAKRDNVNTYLRLTTTLLERIYLKEGNFREAHQFLGELALYTRNFLDEKTEERVGTMQEQIRKAEEESEIKQELFGRKILTISLVTVIGLALLFIAVFAVQKIRLRKAYRELLVRNEELKRQQNEMQSLTQELQTSNATLKNFISVMAHDLKNPFNTIIGFSDLLNTEFETLTPDERKLAIDNTHKSAVNAYALLEQLLSWARLQTGSFHLEVNNMPVVDLMDEVINLFQTSAFLKKQKLSTKIPSGLKIRADRNMMLAVFRNLISNAIKFTPEEGSIDISASLSNQTITVLVKDSGVGISEEGISKLFCIDEPYKTAGTGGEKGTGIGLILCREYLAKNKGALTVESTEGEGSTFIITLPASTG